MKKPPLKGAARVSERGMLMKTYLVGGAVRDELLGLPVREKDWVVVGSTPEAMLAAGFKQVGKDFPVFLHPKTHEEYALARTERKTGQGYHGFSCYSSPDVTLEQDLSRRDLTINAIAKAESGDIIDPFQGQQDLKNKIFRHVSPAFSEDPVRILRIARFAARFRSFGFKIADETMALMQHMVQSGEIDALVSERVWQEMLSALSEEHPSAFFLVLRACGALARLWPDLDCLWGIPQPEQHHPEIDTGVHVMMALDLAAKLSPDTQVRFAALSHDLGKGKTPEKNWPSHRGHEELGVACIEAFAGRYRIPHEYRDLAILVSRYHLHCHRAFELRADTMLKTLEALDVFRKPDRFEKFLLACTADARGRKDKEQEAYIQVDRMRAAYQIAKGVNVDRLREQGLTGEKLGEKIHQERVRAIAAGFDEHQSRY